MAFQLFNPFTTTPTLLSTASCAILLCYFYLFHFYLFYFFLFHFYLCCFYLCHFYRTPWKAFTAI